MHLHTCASFTVHTSPSMAVTPSLEVNTYNTRKPCFLTVFVFLKTRPSTYSHDLGCLSIIPILSKTLLRPPPRNILTSLLSFSGNKMLDGQDGFCKCFVGSPTTAWLLLLLLRRLLLALNSHFSWIYFYLITILYFWWFWGLNPGPSTCLLGKVSIIELQNSRFGILF